MFSYEGDNVLDKASVFIVGTSVKFFKPFAFGVKNLQNTIYYLKVVYLQL